MEAIRVPSPPRLVPTIRASHSEVKPERSKAAGTLLMTWLAHTAVTSSWPEMACSSSERKAGTRPMFPIKTKNAAKVSSRDQSTRRSTRRSAARTHTTTAAVRSHTGSSLATEETEARNRSRYIPVRRRRREGSAPPGARPARGALRPGRRQSSSIRPDRRV